MRLLDRSHRFIDRCASPKMISLVVAVQLGFGPPGRKFFHKEYP